MAEPEVRVGRRDNYLSWAANHPELISTVLVFAIVLTRIMAASRGNIATALAFLRSGPAAVILASLLPIVPFAAGYFGIFALCKYGRGFMGGGRFRADLSWLVFGLTCAAFYLTVETNKALLYGVAMMGASMVLDVIQAVRRDEPFAMWAPRHSDRWTLPPIALLMLVVPAQLIGGQMWLSLEALTEDGEVTVGYVLEDDGEWMTVVLEPRRTIEYMRISSVMERTVCAVSSNATVVSLTADKETIVGCASLGKRAGEDAPSPK